MTGPKSGPDWPIEQAHGIQRELISLRATRATVAVGSDRGSRGGPMGRDNRVHLVACIPNCQGTGERSRRLNQLSRCEVKRQIEHASHRSVRRIFRGRGDFLSRARFWSFQRMAKVVTGADISSIAIRIRRRTGRAGRFGGLQSTQRAISFQSATNKWALVFIF